IEIIDVAPNGLSYSTPNVFTVNQTITDLTPTVLGENLTFSISPSLPNGLSFDTSTGAISGTPTEIQDATDYEVTATNSGGSTSFVLSIEIIDVVPNGLTYNTPNVFTVNQTITDLVPTVLGENLVFSIVPSLPNGLSFDTSTGIISGTPTEIQDVTDYEVTATNSGGSTSFVLSIEIIDVAPNGLSYSTPNIFTVNQTIADLVPTVTGENLTFSIDPSLPNGLSFDTSTGIISGTPTEIQDVTDYEVTATNSGGSTSFVLSIEIIDVAPNSLSYSTPNVFTVNQTITDLTPTVTGENLVYSIVPSLPNGLSFDTETGIISGTPTEIQDATDYEVTVTNSGGSTSFVLSIEIIDLAPTMLTYSTPNVFTVNQTITDLTPTVSGENLTYSIVPSLPNGLSFDTSTGIISGTPTEIQDATDYEVTATNSGGSTSFVLSIEIIDVAPNGLSYSTPNVFTVNQTITDLTPTVTGENLTYSIVPSLPSGLSLDTSTGIIFGTPTEIQDATDYEVTATNSGGSTSFVLSIEIIDVAPNGLTYNTPNVFTVNQTITDLTPTVTGENLTFSINPSLPNGLSFDTSTGIISGTPTETQDAIDYEVTATNSGGSISFVVSIAVEEELGLIDEVKKMFTVYPNPFENEINVVHEFDEVQYSIFSLDGKEIQFGILQNSKIMINQLPSSVYLLKLQSEDKVQIIKIVKQ
uniref:putative Ig domain-containing protein n=1 Tax=Flavobacterium sp. TaxID=239 RepID=UPI0035AEB830